MRKIYRQHQPDVVHHVGLKLILWGGLAAKHTKVKGVLNAVSGLGILFDDAHKKSFLRRGMTVVLRWGHRRKNVLDLFQNHEDEAIFVNSGITQPADVRFIKGSGVDLSKFCPTPERNDGKIRVLFSGRMVREKGVGVLVEAAELLRHKYEGKVEFVLCGGLHANPRAYKEDEIRRMCDGDYISWKGLVSDMHEQLNQCHIFAFPSAYREGVPKSLLEACATGRPIVTTDNTGCRDVVEDGINGFLVPVYDAPTLADRLARLIDDKELRARFGNAARKQAEREFSIEMVTQRHLEIYEELNADAQPDNPSSSSTSPLEPTL